MKLKIAAMALALVGFSNTYAADIITWEPHVRDGYKCTHAQYCNISGQAKMVITNDTDEAHSYTIHLGMTSDGGAPVGGAGQWNYSFTVVPHTTWTENQTVAGYVKFNMMGQREVDLVVRTEGYQDFYQMQKGWIEAV